MPKLSSVFQMDRFPVPETVKAFSDVFRKNGFSLYVVGGAVRDYLLGIENHDYDFCTDALAEEVCKMFHAVIPTGIKHGTVTVLFRGQSFEVTTFRTETDYSDHRHPDGVSFVRTLDEDLSRRDFTVNAFAADCTTGEITDIFNGREDLKNRVIRAIGEPKQRFREDALRLLRMCRFCSKLGFEPDRITFSAAQSLASFISYVSQERIYDELSKILKSTKPSVGLRLAEDCGLISYILPELAECRNTKQEKTGSSDVLEHIYNAVDAAASAGYCHEVRLACLLHDIGKPSSMTVKDGVMKFYGHDTSGAEMAVKVMKRLKCSNKTIDEVHTIIANHMVRYSRDWTDGAVKRFMCRIGSEVTIHHLFEMGRT